jgi:hypothetical protein
VSNKYIKKEAFIAGKDDYTRQSNMNIILNNQSRDIQIIVIAFKLNKLCCAKKKKIIILYGELKQCCIDNTKPLP